MKFTIQQRDAGMALHAEPGLYDAVPLTAEVWVDAIPWVQHPDRTAVALCLIFYASSAGTFELPGVGCSSQVASAIEGFFEPTECRVFPINLEPSRIVGGEVSLNLSFCSKTEKRRVQKPAGREVVEMRLMGEGVGGFASGSEFTVATNALLAASNEDRPMHRLLPGLGVAVLFCEDLFVEEVRLPFDANEDPELARRLQVLLDSVGLRIAWSESNH